MSLALFFASELRAGPRPFFAAGPRLVWRKQLSLAWAAPRPAAARRVHRFVFRRGLSVFCASRAVAAGPVRAEGRRGCAYSPFVAEYCRWRCSLHPFFRSSGSSRLPVFRARGSTGGVHDWIARPPCPVFLLDHLSRQVVSADLLGPLTPSKARRSRVLKQPVLPPVATSVAAGHPPRSPAGLRLPRAERPPRG